MTHAEAKQVFASLMATARKRSLTAHEKQELSFARQQLRRARRPAMNSAFKTKTTRTRRRTSNPASGVKIYGRILRIEAQKTQSHRCDTACRKAKHCYFHDFTTRNASIYGMPDGSLVVR